MSSNYDQIRADNIREYGEGIRHLSFLGRLYTDRTHFLFELLQNTEDAGASRILFELFENRLEVKHDGRPFDDLDVRGVCGVGEGTKAEDLTQIGKFGIGFKSVYAYTSTPEVHSGDEHFRIEHYVRPCQAEPRAAGELWTTLFVFNFNATGIEKDAACREIAARLRNLSSRTLLFLRRIKEIEYKLPDKTRGVYLREEVARGPARQVTVIGRSDEEDNVEKWLVFEKPVPVADSTTSVRVEIAFKLETNIEDHTEVITRIKDSQLIVYFPTEKPTRLGCLIQGPYRTTPSRDNIPKDDPWNETLIEATVVLFAETLENLKEMKLLTVALLEALPIRMEEFSNDSMFYPIARGIVHTLMEQELLPADDGTFVSARNAKLARGADLRKLLRQDQLKALSKSKDQVKWLAGEITQDRSPDLRSYLMNDLSVEEITPDSFARQVADDFLERQTDDWMVALYRFVAPLRALWGKYSGLRSKRFIRLQDGSHVTPFRDDSSPNAYLPVGSNFDTSLPIVKAELCLYEDVRQFLSELGIPDLDIVAEVIDRVLPKYLVPLAVPCEEHWRDLTKIELAYATDSQDRKRRLREALQATPFILCEKPGRETASYQRPIKSYFRNDELMTYFAGNDTVGFIIADYRPSALALFKDLGVTDSVRVQKRQAVSRLGYVFISSQHGWHQRGLYEFDPDIWIDGLEHALANPTIERSVFIWNHIAVPYTGFIRGLVETSTRQTYDFSNTESRVSKFGDLLIDSAWLPGVDGEYLKPSAVGLDDLSELFFRDEKLADQLGMKADVVAKLAKQAGVEIEDIEFVKTNAAEFKKWKDEFSGKKDGKKVKPEFPERASSKPERREERLSQQLNGSQQKRYEQRDRSVRTTRNDINPALWLRSLYTNDVGQMICQVCEDEMPFRKRRWRTLLRIRRGPLKRTLP
jgi:hypothetical protein